MKRFLLSIILLMFLLMVGQAWSATYYVSNTTSNGYVAGNNGNNGTAKATPWLTMVYADTTATAGDTIYVNGGAYEETYSAAYSMGFTKRLNWIADGAVTVGKSDRTAGAVYVGNTAGSLSVGSLTGSQFIFDSFSVTASQSIIAYYSVSNVTFTNCSFRNAVSAHMQAGGSNANWKFDTCTFDDSPTFTFSNASPSLTITNSTWPAFTHTEIIYNTTGSFTFSNNVVSNINSSSNAQALLDLLTSGTATITGNIFTVISLAQPIVLAKSNSTGGTLTVTGNTFNVVASSAGALVSVAGGDWLSTISSNTMSVTTTWSNTSKGLIYIVNQTRPATITSNIASTTPTGAVAHIAADGSGGAHIITDNTSTTNSQSGYVIRIGSEASTVSDNTMQGVTISRNHITAPVGAATIHGIIYGHNDNGVIERNYITGAADSLVIKGSSVYAIPFNNGTTAPTVAATIHGKTSGSTGIVGYFTLTSGAWDGTGVGTIYINTRSAAWLSGEEIDTAANGKIADTTGVDSLYYAMDWTNGRVDNNVIDRPSFSGLWIKGVKNVSVYNNTWVEDNSTYAAYGMIQVTNNGTSNNPATGTSIKNNIFYISNSLSKAIYVDSQSNSNFVSDYNNFYRANSNGYYGQISGTYYPTWSGAGSWQAAGYDAYGINSNPIFVSSSDFHLGSPASPVIYAGINPCTAAGVPLSCCTGNGTSSGCTDYEGLPRPIPGAPGWTIGAYEPWRTRKIF